MFLYPYSAPPPPFVCMYDDFCHEKVLYSTYFELDQSAPDCLAFASKKGGCELFYSEKEKEKELFFLFSLI